MQYTLTFGTESNILQVAHLSLVKSVSRLQEEQKHFDEVFLEFSALAFTRGALIEVSGGAASGKTAIALSLLAKLTADGEIIVDRAAAKNPITFTVYGSGANGIAGNLTNAIVKAVYARLSQANALRTADKSLTEAQAFMGGDKAKAASIGCVQSA